MDALDKFIEGYKKRYPELSPDVAPDPKANTGPDALDEFIKGYWERLKKDGIQPAVSVDVTPGITPEVSTRTPPVEIGASFAEYQYPSKFPKQREPSFLEQVGDVFTGSLRTTPEVEALPELASPAFGELPASGALQKAGMAAVLLLVGDDEAKKGMIKQIVPNVEFETDKHGTTIVSFPPTKEFPKGKRGVLDKPGWSWQQNIGVAGDILAFLFGGAAAKAALGPVIGRLAPRVAASAIGKLAGTAATEGAIQYGLEKVPETLGSGVPVSPVNVGAAALTGGLGKGVEIAGDIWRQAKTSKALGAVIPEENQAEFIEETLKNIKKGKKISEKTDIPLYPAELTGDLNALRLQAYLSYLPKTSQKALQKIKTQNQKAYEAVANYLATIAPERQIGGAAARVRSASQMVIEAQKELRREAASPFYKEAFKNKSRYLPAKTNEMILEKMAKAGTDSPLENSMKRITRYLTPKGTEAQIARGLTIKQLHEAKGSIDDMIGKAVSKRENVLAKHLGEVKRSLIKELRGFSPTYDQARRKFAAQSPAVEALENSIIGRISRFKDPQLKQVATTIFDIADVGTSSVAVRETKKAIEAVDPGAWNDIIRLELEKRIGDVGRLLKEEAGQTAENLPGRLYTSIFGSRANRRRRDILYAALNPEQKKNLRYIEQGLDLASRGRPGGSPTEPWQKIRQDIAKSGVMGSIGNFLRMWRGAREAGEQFNFDRKTIAIASVLLDPKWQPDMAKLRKFRPESRKAGSFFSDLLRRAEKDFRGPALQAARRQATPQQKRVYYPPPVYKEPEDKVVGNGHSEKKEKKK